MVKRPNFVQDRVHFKSFFTLRPGYGNDIAPLAGALVGGGHRRGVGVIGQWLKELLQPSDETMQRLMEVLQ